jgi:hypothetical protein
MCRRQDRIELPRRYAVAAMAGKLQEWYRAHPAVEVMLEPDDLEQVIQAEPVPATSPDLNVLFAEIKAQLSERDRQVLVLLEQDLGPQEIAKAFEISYSAAAKAIQRARDRMAAILSRYCRAPPQKSISRTRKLACLVGFDLTVCSFEPIGCMPEKDYTENRHEIVARSEFRIGAEIVRSFPEILLELFNIFECIRRFCCRRRLLTIPHQHSISPVAIPSFEYG